MRKIKSLLAFIGFAGIIGLAYTIGKSSGQTVIREENALETVTTPTSKISEATLNMLEEGIGEIKENSGNSDDAKRKLGDAISNSIREMGEGYIGEGDTEITEETKKKLKEDIAKTLTDATEDLPYFTESDVDDVVETAIARIESACSEEYISDYLSAGSLKEFNTILAEKFTEDDKGFIGKFMKKWIQYIPDINEVLDNRQ